MLHYLRCKAIYIQRRIAKKFFFTKVYETKVGIKYVYPIFDPSFQETSTSVISMKAQDLYLEFDALKDDYTLCGVSLTSSPHLEFLKALQTGGKLKTTDYVRRFESGTLDMRTSRYVGKDMLTFYASKFEKRRKEVLNGDYKPVSIYKVGGKYYIADGKHRAAMCTLLGLDIKCKVVDIRYLEDSFYHWIYEKMKRTPERYKKNIEFFERFYSNK